MASGIIFLDTKLDNSTFLRDIFFNTLFATNKAKHILINDVFPFLNKCSSDLYADDTTIYTHNNNIGLCLFDLILYIPLTTFQLNRDGHSLVEPVLS